MGMRVPASLQEHFATLTDPRCPHAPDSRHRLMDLLVMAVCAVIGGAEGWEDIAEDGRSQAEWFARLLDVPHGIPGHDTFRRVVSRLDPEELTQCCIAWTQALREASGGDSVSIDGKALRHAFDQAPATAAIHLVRAWASANRLVLGQRPPGPTCTVWGGWNRVVQSGQRSRLIHGIFSRLCQPKPCGSTGGWSTRCIGSLMSLFRRMPAASAKSKERRPVQCFATSPSIFCGASPITNGALKRDENGPDGIETLSSKF